MLTGPTTATTGQPADFDGSASSDPDGRPVRFAWSIDDQDVGVDDPWLSVSFARPGRHVVVVTVTDGDGETASAQRVVTTRGPARANVSPLTSLLPAIGAVGVPTIVLGPPRDRLRDGRLRLLVRCAGTPRCRGILRATIVVGGRPRLLAATSFDVRRGGPSVVRLRLGRRARARLGPRSRVRVSAYRGRVRDVSRWDSASWLVYVSRRPNG